MRSAAEAELASRGKKPREAKSLAEPFGLVLSRICRWHLRCLLKERSLAEGKTLGEEERSLAREKPSRGSPGLESLVLSEIF